MIIVDLGEVGIHFKGDTYTLRPSFYAMSEIGSPAEIVECLAHVMGENPSIEKCAHVIQCCSDSDLSEITGYLDYFVRKNEFHESLRWQPGAMSNLELIAIARCLLKHGMVGVYERRRSKSVDDGDSSTAFFVAKDYVNLAMAHLGLDESSAWKMTMTGLIGALNAKYPPPEDPADRAPSIEEHEEAMNWFASIEHGLNQRDYSNVAKSGDNLLHG